MPSRHALLATSFLLPLSVVLLLALSIPAIAGPPFLTDDPEPVKLHHYEIYAFGTFDRARDSTLAQLPAAEFNVGAAPNLQLHAILPLDYVPPSGAYGLGDVELGAKYRFIKEKGSRPQVGVFPLLELPTGNHRLGLGNGSVWARLPLWLQKSFGPWTTYGGAGYQINRAPGMKDSLFAGWLVQRDLTKRITLGGEFYHQEAQAAGARQTTFFDAGGYYKFSEGFNLLYMLGHTIAGERHTIGYLGLYWTWGRNPQDKQHN